MGKETIKQVTASDTDYGVNILASGVTFNQWNKSNTKTSQRRNNIAMHENSLCRKES